MRRTAGFDVGQFQSAVLNEAGQVLRICTAGHIHVQTRPQRTQGGITPIPCEALDN